MEITIYPKTEHFSLNHYYNGADGLVNGTRTYTDNPKEKYGYLTLPYEETEGFFSNYRNGKGVRLWVQQYIVVEHPRDSMKTDDGSRVSFDMKIE